MDYLKELSIKLGGKIHSQNCRSANFKEKSFRTLIIKNYRSFKIQIDEYGNLYEIRIIVNSDLSFSINNPNRLIPYNKLITVENFPYNLYSSDAYIDNPKNEHFQGFWTSLTNVIKKLKLEDDESIFLYTGCIYLILNSNRNLILILDDIIDLINSNDMIFKKDVKLTIKSKNIPKNLRPLFPLLKKWSIGDDVEREQLLEETGEKQKKKLVSTVYPFMKGINEYLDSFGDEPLSEEAILLGNLAELISELKTD